VDGRFTVGHEAGVWRDPPAPLRWRHDARWPGDGTMRAPCEGSVEPRHCGRPDRFDGSVHDDTSDDAIGPAKTRRLARSLCSDYGLMMDNVLVRKLKC